MFLVMNVEIIELDQWTSTGAFKHIKFDDLMLESINGGSSDAAKKIFGGTFNRKTVSESANPRIGNVWLVKGKNGFPEVWKANYDSSD